MGPGSHSLTGRQQPRRRKAIQLPDESVRGARPRASSTRGSTGVVSKGSAAAQEVAEPEQLALLQPLQGEAMLQAPSRGWEDGQGPGAGPGCAGWGWYPGLRPASSWAPASFLFSRVSLQRVGLTERAPVTSKH